MSAASAEGRRAVQVLRTPVSLYVAAISAIFLSSPINNLQNQAPSPNI